MQPGTESEAEPPLLYMEPELKTKPDKFIDSRSDLGSLCAASSCTIQILAITMAILVPRIHLSINSKKANHALWLCIQLVYTVNE